MQSYTFIIYTLEMLAWLIVDCYEAMELVVKPSSNYLTAIEIYGLLLDLTNGLDLLFGCDTFLGKFEVFQV